MSQLNLSQFSENIPVSSTIAVTQAAAGCGLGLLIADKMTHQARQRASWLLLGAGALVLLPIAASFVSRVRNHPHSRSRAKRQINSIREDVGFADADELSEEII